MHRVTLGGIEPLDALARAGSFSGADVLLNKVTSTVSHVVGQGPSGGGQRAKTLTDLAFGFCVAPRHPLAGWPGTVPSEEVRKHRVIVVSDTARRLPARTVGLLRGQQVLAVPDMRTKYSLQVAGLGVGFLPRLFIRSALKSGLLIEKQVEEPKPDDQVLLAWRTNEQGKALKWWRDALGESDVVPQFLARASQAWVADH